MSRNLEERAEEETAIKLETEPVPPVADSELTEESEPVEKKNKIERKPKKVVLRPDDFRVRLVKGLETSQDSSTRLRSTLAGNEILVDVTHPDFKSRFKKTRVGAPKINERVCCYLASVVSAHYRDASYTEFGGPDSHLEAYQDMIGTYCRLEEKLRKDMRALAQEMENLYAIEERDK